ncbi:MAG: 6-phosphogluconolactonase [Chloroflexota bacterium]|nr:6-phosphogluconolactonase [Chloroflexota bacterium]
MTQIQIFRDSQALANAAAELFIKLAEQSVRDQGRFSVALSGGNTPSTLYQVLANPENQERLNWAGIHLFWGDERHVPPDHKESNYRKIRETLLDRIAIPEENVHRVKAEMEERLAALSYEQVLRDFFVGQWPRFDLILLGLGEDGHTASLFPHSAGLKEEERWFIPNYAPKREKMRLTLTKNAINAAKNIAVLVSGASKAGILAEVLRESDNLVDTPIQLILPRDGEMIWLLDNQSASQLAYQQSS